LTESKRNKYIRPRTVTHSLRAEVFGRRVHHEGPKGAHLGTITWLKLTLDHPTEVFSLLRFKVGARKETKNEKKIIIIYNFPFIKPTLGKFLDAMSPQKKHQSILARIQTFNL
jgi:hypothetical protein